MTVTCVLQVDPPRPSGRRPLSWHLSGEMRPGEGSALWVSPRWLPGGESSESGVFPLHHDAFSRKRRLAADASICSRSRGPGHPPSA